MYPEQVKGGIGARYAGAMAAGAENELEHPSRTDVPPVADAPRSSAGARRWLDVLAIAALLLLALIAVLPQVEKQAPLSALDEPSHFDYAWHASHFEFPAAGDTFAPEVMEAWNCYGNELLRLPTCGTTGPPEAYPALAQQYNFGHPPVYYLVTGLAARAIEALSDVDFLTAARAMGAIWLGAGMAVMHLALRGLGVALPLAASVAAASGMWWSSFSAATIVTNDAPFLLTTALGLLALAGLRRRHPYWLTATLLILLAALAAGVKVMHALPFLAIAGAFVVLALLPDRYRPFAGRWSLLGTAAGMVGAVGAVYVLWTRFQRARGDADWSNPVEGVNTAPFLGSPFDEWLPTSVRGLTYVGHAYIANASAEPEIVIFASDMLSVVLLGSIVIGLAVARRGSALLVIALAALIGSAAWPLVVQLQSYLSSDGTHYFPMPSRRYGVSIGVLGFAALALVAQRLRWHWFVIAGCVLSVVTTFAALAMAPPQG